MRRTLWLTLLVGSALSVQALAEETPPTDDEARRAKVVAKIGSVTITVGDIEDKVAARSPYARKRLTSPDTLRALADAQVENELFYQGAKKLGYADDPEVQKFVDQTAMKIFVRREFEETVTPDEVPQEQVDKYYREHPNEFRRPEMRRARHILVGSKAEAEEVLKILRTEAETFRAVAKNRSLDTETNVRGGDLLYFTAEGEVVGKEAEVRIDATLAESAFSLEKAGDIAGPLDLGDGKWSVLELTGIRPERVKDLERAAPMIRRKLWREEREGALEALVTKLRVELKPEVHPERLDAIVLTPGTGATEPPSQ
ncbi:MAG: peptidyl-prolyl cis-trans isomerase [Myxococcales bacterium]|nr:MAG: peptidyl-prolyl cis-trans isomerase [Myxococcales bacterium]